MTASRRSRSAGRQRHFRTGEHIVRTLWASHYATQDPENAGWVAMAHLGQTSERSRKHYEVAVRRSRSVTLLQEETERMMQAG